MIPRMNIIAWSNVVPWAELRQVEQDLVISRAIVELFSDSLLRKELRFRGGTALNKLCFPKPYRYSEDIDFTRTTAGPIGPILGRVREVLAPWLGDAAFEQSQHSPKLRFTVLAEDASDAAQIRLKIEINTREREAYDKPQAIPMSVENPWFSGTAAVATFSNEELLATKFRALLQRDKGRDLFDLAHAMDVFQDLDVPRVVELFLRYLASMDSRISRAEAEQRMFAKLSRSRIMADLKPLLAADVAAQLTDDAVNVAFIKVYSRFVQLLPGEPWAKSEEMMNRFGLAEFNAK